MKLIKTKDGEMTRADAAGRNFSSHYEEMRKYHTNVKRLMSRKINKNNKSGNVGVWQASPNTYTAYITLRRKKIHLGTFGTYQEAVEARRKAEEQYYEPIINSYIGEFSRA